MDNKIKLMKPHTDDVATTFNNSSKVVNEDSNVNLFYKNNCSYNYFGTNSGLSYNDDEHNVFWEF